MVTNNTETNDTEKQTSKVEVQHIHLPEEQMRSLRDAVDEFDRVQADANRRQERLVNEWNARVNSLIKQGQQEVDKLHEEIDPTVQAEHAKFVATVQKLVPHDPNLFDAQISACENCVVLTPKVDETAEDEADQAASAARSFLQSLFAGMKK